MNNEKLSRAIKLAILTAGASSVALPVAAQEEVIEEFRGRSPIGHLVTVDEVVWAVELLLAPQARAMAGGTLLLDAGQRTAIP